MGQLCRLEVQEASFRAEEGMAALRAHLHPEREVQVVALARRTWGIEGIATYRISKDIRHKDSSKTDLLWQTSGCSHLLHAKLISSLNTGFELDFR